MTRDHPGAHVVNRQEGRHRGTRHRERFEDQRRIEPRQSGAALFLGHVDGAEAEGREFGEDLAGNGAVLLPLMGEGRDLLGAEAARHVENGFLLRSQGEIHRLPPLATHVDRSGFPPPAPAGIFERGSYRIVGMTNSAPSLIPEGQREVTVLVRV